MTFAIADCQPLTRRNICYYGRIVALTGLKSVGAHGLKRVCGGLDPLDVVPEVEAFGDVDPHVGEGLESIGQRMIRSVVAVDEGP